MKRRVVVLVASAAGVILLTVAAAVGIRSYVDEETRLTPPVVEPTPVFDTEGELAAFVAEYGESPPREPYNEAERETARQIELEAMGLQTLASHPAAQLPSIAFTAYDDAARSNCLASAGVSVDYAYGDNILQSEAQAIAAYFCLGTFPPEPHLRPTDRQLHYVYAYWTTFLVPCYEAFDFPQPTPIPEDEFVARYWLLDWHLVYPESTPGSAVDTQLVAVDTACPSSPPGA